MELIPPLKPDHSRPKVYTPTNSLWVKDDKKERNLSELAARYRRKGSTDEHATETQGLTKGRLRFLHKPELTKSSIDFERKDVVGADDWDHIYSVDED